MALTVRSSASASRIACSNRSFTSGRLPFNSVFFKPNDVYSSLECSGRSRRSRTAAVVAMYGRGSGMYWQRFQAHTSSTDSTMVRSVPVQVAHDLLKAGHHYLDVRTSEEFAAGHVEGAINVPFMFKAGTEMNRNLDFVHEVSAQFNKDDEIVVGCQSGRRSLLAANELLASGFTGVTDMGGGFGAWLQTSLPVFK